MFGGEGLMLVRLDEPDLDARLAVAVKAAWDAAPTLSGTLREHARDQIAASARGFDRVFELVESNRRSGPRGEVEPCL